MSEEPTTGQMITANLRIVRPLGEGGMGSVWVAEHLGLRTQVVVKFMSPDLATTQEGAARFSKEAADTAQVRSPHVVQTLDYGVTEVGVPYMVMELLEGHDLDAHLATHGAMAPHDVVAIVSQLARALTRVHEKGIIHRDIKPNNIFLCDVGDGEMFVKLLDFGVAKSRRKGDPTSPVAKITSTGAVLGTPYYMSPEQIVGEGEIDARSDLWSVAIVVFEALTGVKPFDGETIGGLAVKILRDPLPLPSHLRPDLPSAIDAWFAHACSRKPSDRFESAREMADALAKAVGSPSAMAESRPRWSSLPPVASRRDRSGKAYAPTEELNASTPGVGVAVSQAEVSESLVAKPPRNRVGLIGMVVAGVLGLGLVAWLVLPRMLSTPEPSVNAVESGSSPSVADPPANSPEVSVVDPLPVASEASAEPPSSSSAASAASATPTKPPPRKVGKPPRKPVKPTPTTTATPPTTHKPPRRVDDIW